MLLDLVEVLCVVLAKQNMQNAVVPFEVRGCSVANRVCEKVQKLDYAYN
jgi:hypothetical protein